MSESRLWTTEYERSAPGRTAIGIRCPFCDVVVEAYVWSLAGSGKLCDCGAKHVWLGRVSER